MDPKEYDKDYRPFAPFENWASFQVKNQKWTKFQNRLSQLRESSPQKLKEALNLVTRAAAIETGALESLYEIDRGFTLTVAAGLATWEAALEAKGERAKNLIQSQLDAYDLVLDFATKNRDVAEVWIRELHEVLCKSQGTYDVHTAAGLQQQELPLGKYKENPNHVIKRDKSIHAYAPVHSTSAEMKRLLDEIRTELFQKAHPLLQAAYIHHAFVVIHPFADGNGRVARALASVFTYRAASVPLLITLDNKGDYFDALSDADNGDHASFITFIEGRADEVVDLVEASLRATKLPAPEEILTNINKFYVTAGGYTFDQIDHAGFGLINELEKLFKQRFLELQDTTIQPFWTVGTEQLSDIDSAHRATVNSKGNNMFRAEFATPQPAEGRAICTFYVQVPIQGEKSDTVKIVAKFHANSQLPVFEVQLRDLVPRVTISVYMKLSIFVIETLSIALAELKRSGETTLRSKGYIK
jgi:Fic family protein